ncbi:MAG: hypothetical protein K2Z81_02105 [Cyanobacteria bacterium]|nr:hypothetical protein [Cyanobacteriota bacterium]
MSRNSCAKELAKIDSSRAPLIQHDFLDNISTHSEISFHPGKSHTLVKPDEDRLSRRCLATTYGSGLITGI